MLSAVLRSTVSSETKVCPGALRPGEMQLRTSRKDVNMVAEPGPDPRTGLQRPSDDSDPWLLDDPWRQNSTNKAKNIEKTEEEQKSLQNMHDKLDKILEVLSGRLAWWEGGC